AVTPPASSSKRDNAVLSRIGEGMGDNVPRLATSRPASAQVRRSAVMEPCPGLRALAAGLAMNLADVTRMSVALCATEHRSRVTDVAR
ncbi:MAG: hypothetical protein WBC94_10690, partial [Xanthobacteraceae bacterium]